MDPMAGDLDTQQVLADAGDPFTAGQPYDQQLLRLRLNMHMQQEGNLVLGDVSSRLPSSGRAGDPGDAQTVDFTSQTARLQQTVNGVTADQVELLDGPQTKPRTSSASNFSPPPPESPPMSVPNSSSYNLPLATRRGVSHLSSLQQTVADTRVQSSPLRTSNATQAWLQAASSAPTGGQGVEVEQNPTRRRSEPARVSTSLSRPIPDLSPFRGTIDFHVEPPEDELASGKPISRSAAWTFDNSQRTLYVKPNKPCPFRVQFEGDLPKDAVLHITFAFEEAEHLFEPVVRCANHRESQTAAGFGLHDRHFGISDNPAAMYEVDMRGRPFIVIPYFHKRPGIHNETFQFVCYTSSCTPFKKKTLKMIISIKTSNNTVIIGRDIVYLRVCACPGRDRNAAATKKEPSNGERRKRAHTETEDDDDEVYTIKRTVRGHHNFRLVNSVLDALITNLQNQQNIAEKAERSPNNVASDNSNSP